MEAQLHVCFSLHEYFFSHSQGPLSIELIHPDKDIQLIEQVLASNVKVIKLSLLQVRFNEHLSGCVVFISRMSPFSPIKPSGCAR